MSNFLLMGLACLAVMILELLLSETFGDHLIQGSDSWDMRFDAKAWHRHEIKMFAVSTVLICLVVYSFRHDIYAVEGVWRNLGMIFGGFGYCITPIYLRRILWNKCVFC